LSQKVTIGSVLRRHRHRELGNRPRPGRVAHVDDPDRLVRLVAIGIQHLGIGDHEAAVEAGDVYGVKEDRSRLVVGRESAYEPRIPDVREVVHQHPKEPYALYP
jgi:hypothetical protein